MREKMLNSNKKRKKISLKEVKLSGLIQENELYMIMKRNILNVIFPANNKISFSHKSYQRIVELIGRYVDLNFCHDESVILYNSNKSMRKFNENGSNFKMDLTNQNYSIIDNLDMIQMDRSNVSINESVLNLSYNDNNKQIYSKFLRLLEIRKRLDHLKVSQSSNSSFNKISKFVKGQGNILLIMKYMLVWINHTYFYKVFFDDAICDKKLKKSNMRLIMNRLARISNKKITVLKNCYEKIHLKFVQYKNHLLSRKIFEDNFNSKLLSSKFRWLRGVLSRNLFKKINFERWKSKTFFSNSSITDSLAFKKTNKNNLYLLQNTLLTIIHLKDLKIQNYANVNVNFNIQKFGNFEIDIDEEKFKQIRFKIFSRKTCKKYIKELLNNNAFIKQKFLRKNSKFQAGELKRFDKMINYYKYNSLSIYFNLNLFEKKVLHEIYRRMHLKCRLDYFKNKLAKSKNLKVFDNDNVTRIIPTLQAIKSLPDDKLKLKKNAVFTKLLLPGFQVLVNFILIDKYRCNFIHRNVMNNKTTKLFKDGILCPMIPNLEIISFMIIPKFNPLKNDTLLRLIPAFQILLNNILFDKDQDKFISKNFNKKKADIKIQENISTPVKLDIINYKDVHQLTPRKKSLLLSLIPPFRVLVNYLIFEKGKDKFFPYNVMKNEADKIFEDEILCPAIPILNSIKSSTIDKLKPKKKGVLSKLLLPGFHILVDFILLDKDQDNFIPKNVKNNKVIKLFKDDIPFPTTLILDVIESHTIDKLKLKKKGVLSKLLLPGFQVLVDFILLDKDQDNFIPKNVKNNKVIKLFKDDIPFPTTLILDVIESHTIDKLKLKKKGVLSKLLLPGFQVLVDFILLDKDQDNFIPKNVKNNKVIKLFKDDIPFPTTLILDVIESHTINKLKPKKKGVLSKLLLPGFQVLVDFILLDKDQDNFIPKKIQNNIKITFSEDKIQNFINSKENMQIKRIISDNKIDLNEIKDIKSPDIKSLNEHQFERKKNKTSLLNVIKLSKEIKNETKYESLISYNESIKKENLNSEYNSDLKKESCQYLDNNEENAPKSEFDEEEQDHKNDEKLEFKNYQNSLRSMKETAVKEIKMSNKPSYLNKQIKVTTKQQDLHQENNLSQIINLNESKEKKNLEALYLLDGDLELNENIEENAPMSELQSEEVLNNVENDLMKIKQETSEFESKKSFKPTKTNKRSDKFHQLELQKNENFEMKVSSNSNTNSNLNLNTTPDSNQNSTIKISEDQIKDLKLNSFSTSDQKADKTFSNVNYIEKSLNTFSNTETNLKSSSHSLFNDEDENKQNCSKIFFDDCLEKTIQLKILKEKLIKLVNINSIKSAVICNQLLSVNVKNFIIDYKNMKDNQNKIFLDDENQTKLKNFKFNDKYELNVIPNKPVFKKFEDTILENKIIKISFEPNLFEIIDMNRKKLINKPSNISVNSNSEKDQNFGIKNELNEQIANKENPLLIKNLNSNNYSKSINKICIDDKIQKNFFNDNKKEEDSLPSENDLIKNIEEEKHNKNLIDNNMNTKILKNEIGQDEEVSKLDSINSKSINSDKLHNELEDKSLSENDSLRPNDLTTTDNSINKKNDSAELSSNLNIETISTFEKDEEVSKSDSINSNSINSDKLHNELEDKSLSENDFLRPNDLTTTDNSINKKHDNKELSSNLNFKTISTFENKINSNEFIDDKKSSRQIKQYNNIIATQLYNLSINKILKNDSEDNSNKGSQNDFIKFNEQEGDSKNKIKSIKDILNIPVDYINNILQYNAIVFNDDQNEKSTDINCLDKINVQDIISPKYNSFFDNKISNSFFFKNQFEDLDFRSELKQDFKYDSEDNSKKGSQNNFIKFNVQEGDSKNKIKSIKDILNIPVDYINNILQYNAIVFNDDQNGKSTDINCLDKINVQDIISPKYNSFFDNKISNSFFFKNQFEDLDFRSELKLMCDYQKINQLIKFHAYLNLNQNQIILIEGNHSNIKIKLASIKNIFKKSSKILNFIRNMRIIISPIDSLSLVTNLNLNNQKLIKFNSLNFKEKFESKKVKYDELINDEFKVAVNEFEELKIMKIKIGNNEKNFSMPVNDLKFQKEISTVIFNNGNEIEKNSIFLKNEFENMSIFGNLSSIKMNLFYDISSDIKEISSLKFNIIKDDNLIKEMKFKFNNSKQFARYLEEKFHQLCVTAFINRIFKFKWPKIANVKLKLKSIEKESQSLYLELKNTFINTSKGEFQIDLYSFSHFIYKIFSSLKEIYFGFNYNKNISYESKERLQNLLNLIKKLKDLITKEENKIKENRAIRDKAKNVLCDYYEVSKEIDKNININNNKMKNIDEFLKNKLVLTITTFDEVANNFQTKAGKIIHSTKKKNLCLYLKNIIEKYMNESVDMNSDLQKEFLDEIKNLKGSNKDVKFCVIFEDDIEKYLKEIENRKLEKRFNDFDVSKRLTHKYNEAKIKTKQLEALKEIRLKEKEKLDQVIKKMNSSNESINENLNPDNKILMTKGTFQILNGILIVFVCILLLFTLLNNNFNFS